MTQGMRILGVMAKSSQASRRIEAIESTAVGTDAERSGVILANGADARIAQAARCAIVDEVVARGFVTAQAAVRAHPDPAAVVGKQSAFLFFQAEEGIRDIGVTGVQTCALPI